MPSLDKFLSTIKLHFICYHINYMGLIRGHESNFLIAERFVIIH